MMPTSRLLSCIVARTSQNSSWKSFNKTIFRGAWGSFLENTGNFLDLESHSKISNLTITELFYSHIC